MLRKFIKTEKMAACSDCSICRDSFDAVLVIIYANMLETYYNFLEETVSVIQKVKQSEFLTYQWIWWAKNFVLKGGLTRHIKRKHPESLYEENEDVTTADEKLTYATSF